MTGCLSRGFLSCGEFSSPLISFKVRRSSSLKTSVSSSPAWSTLNMSLITVNTSAPKFLVPWIVCLPRLAALAPKLVISSEENRSSASSIRCRSSCSRRNEPGLRKRVNLETPRSNMHLVLSRRSAIVCESWRVPQICSHFDQLPEVNQVDVFLYLCPGKR